ncbi:MAG: hypothetical protein V1872_05950 [bacterium]
MVDRRKFLGELLVEKGIITQLQLDSLLGEIKNNGTQSKLGLLAIEKGYASEEDVARCLSTQLNIPYDDLSTLTNQEELIKLIPPDILATFQVIPVEKIGEYLLLAMVNPIDIQLIDFLQKETGLRIIPSLTTVNNIREILKRYASLPKNSPDYFSELELEIEDESRGSNELLKIKIKIIGNSPLYTLFAKALEIKATEIHLDFSDEEKHYRYKIGNMFPKKDKP